MVLFPLAGQCKDFKILKPHLSTSYTLLLSCTLIFFYLLWPLWEIILYSFSFRFIYTCIILFFLFISSYISEPLSWIIFLLPKELSVLPLASDNFSQLFFPEKLFHIYLGKLFRDLPLLLFSHSVLPDSLWPHGLHSRLPHASPSPGVCLNSCPLS